MVDNLRRGSRCGGVCREVPVGDLCPGRADGREFGATDVARGLTRDTVHLHRPLTRAVLRAQALGLRLLHGQAAAILEVIYLLPAICLGCLPIGCADGCLLPMCILAQVPALPLLGLGPLDEALSAKVERGDEDVSVGVPAAAVIMYRPVARLRGEHPAEVAHAGAAAVGIELDRQRKLIAQRDELVAAAALGPCPLGHVPELAAPDGRHATGQRQTLLDDAFLPGIVAELPRPLFHKRLARLVRGLPDRARPGGGRAAAVVQMEDGHASSFQARGADAPRAAARSAVSRGRRTVPAARSARERSDRAARPRRREPSQANGFGVGRRAVCQDRTQCRTFDASRQKYCQVRTTSGSDIPSSRNFTVSMGIFCCKDKTLTSKEGRSFMTASIDEQIARKRAAADKQAARAAALKKELRDLEKKKAAAERKARTHRLVEVGAILEQTAGMTFDTEDSRRALSVALTEQLRYTDGTPFTRGGQIAEAVGMLLGDRK